MRSDVATVTLFLALLAVVAQVATAGTLAVAGGAALGLAPARDWLASLRTEAQASGRWLAATVAGVCTAGSLWLSEGAGFPPCRLCWYQRAAMYPLVVLLPLAAGRPGQTTGRVAAGASAVLAAAGAAIATWHVAIERYPSLEGAAACDPANPCSIIWVERLGYLTIPTMALSGFLLILALLALSHRSRS